MNIFVLDNNHQKTVEYYCDSHVNKMILESGQMLGHAHYFAIGILNSKMLKEKIKFGFDASNIFPEFPTKIPGIGYAHHPCTVWVRTSTANYIWMCRLGLAMCDEYEFRRGKPHAWRKVIEWHLSNVPNLTKSSEITPHCLCMPKSFKIGTAVESYRFYYALKKISHKNFKYTKRSEPHWLTDSLIESAKLAMISDKESFNTIQFDGSDKRFIDSI